MIDSNASKAPAVGQLWEITGYPQWSPIVRIAEVTQLLVVVDLNDHDQWCWAPEDFVRVATFRSEGLR